MMFEVKYVKQMLLILALSFVGEILKEIIPLPVPASIYGMVLLLICLMTGWIKLSAVRETGKFLIEIMPLLFIPAGVGLMTSWGVMKPLLLPICVITVVSLVNVMVVSGKTAQQVIRTSKKGREEAEHE